MTIKKIILYIEDDEDDYLLLSQAFQRFEDRFTLIHAKNAAAGMDILKGAPFDHFPCIVLLDMNIPLIDGKQTLLKIKEEFPVIDVILFSTSMEIRDGDFALANGAEFISKPRDYEGWMHIADCLVERQTENN